MKSLIFLSTLFFSAKSFAFAILITASGGSPIPDAYSLTDTQSKVINCGITRELEIINNTSTLLAIGFKAEGALPSNDYAFILAGPNAGRVFLKQAPDVVFGNGTVIYLRSTEAAITSGTVAISCL